MRVSYVSKLIRWLVCLGSSGMEVEGVNEVEVDYESDAEDAEDEEQHAPSKELQLPH